MFDQKIKDVKATIERIKAMLAAKSFDSVYLWHAAALALL